MSSCGCKNSCKCHNETLHEHYMFFGNLETIKRMVDELLSLEPNKIDSILNEHNWAVDHIATSTDDIAEVYNFLVNLDSKDTPEITSLNNDSIYIETFESFTFKNKK